MCVVLPTRNIFNNRDCVIERNTFGPFKGSFVTGKIVLCAENRKEQKQFDICGTVHHHSINKNNQRDAACSLRLYYVLW